MNRQSLHVLATKMVVENPGLRLTDAVKAMGMGSRGKNNPIWLAKEKRLVRLRGYRLYPTRKGVQVVKKFFG